MQNTMGGDEEGGPVKGKGQRWLEFSTSVKTEQESHVLLEGSEGHVLRCLKPLDLPYKQKEALLTGF